MGGSQPGAVDRQSLLDCWYRPHHLKLDRIVNDVAARSGVCLIIDCHSFPSNALPYEPDQTAHRADIRIGTVSFHTPLLIRDAIVAATKKAIFSQLSGSKRADFCEFMPILKGFWVNLAIIG